MPIPTALTLFGPGVTETHNGVAMIVDQQTVEGILAYRKEVDSKDVVPIMINHGMEGIESSKSYGKGRVDVSFEKGIRLVDIEWNEAGAKLVENETFLYTSPRVTGTLSESDAGELEHSARGSWMLRPQMIDELSLCNVPATTNMKPLMTVALSRKKKGAANLRTLTLTCSRPIDDNTILLSKEEPEEGSEDPASDEEVTDEESKEIMDKLKQENDELRLKVSTLEDKVDAYEKEKSQQESTALVAKLKADGYVGESVSTYLLSQPLAKVKEFDTASRKEKPVALKQEPTPNRQTVAQTESTVEPIPGRASLTVLTDRINTLKKKGAR